MDERLKYAPCGYISITHEGIITTVNQTFLEQMEYAAADLVGKHIEALMSTANKLIFHSYFYPVITLEGKVEELLLSLKSHSGQSVPYLLNGRRINLGGVEAIDCILVQMGKRVNYEQELRTAKKQVEAAYEESGKALAQLKQIYQEIEQKQAELVRMNAILTELSVTDKLTGLKNRRFFQEQLEQRVALYEATGQLCSLLIVDIDHFKRVNDTYGHQTGDQVLEKLGAILKLHARQDDVIARYGGEEFVAVLPGTGAAEAKAIAERLRLAVAGASWEVGSITVSIGIATIAPAESAAAMVKRADEALYASKTGGRNRTTHSAAIPGETADGGGNAGQG